MASDDAIMRRLSPWLLRADEVAVSDPRVAYYLREHAMQEALRLGSSQPALPRTKKALQSLMTLLETDRPKAGLQGKEADGAHVRAFAGAVFDRADARVRRALGGCGKCARRCGCTRRTARQAKRSQEL